MVIEISNFLPSSFQNHLEHHVTSSVFPWFFIGDVTREFYDRNSYHKSGFHHTPFLDGNPLSTEYDQIIFLPHYIRQVLGNDNLVLQRIRYGMNIRSDGDDLYNTPHIDFPDNFPHKHYTALYYVNNCDGDTFIFNEKTRSEEYSIHKRISPEKGKICIFDGEHFHASSYPKESDYRIVLTLNLYDPS